MKFIADEMVGKLARWLRAAGYDTLYLNPVSDEDLIDVAQRENRIVLTRDHKLGAGTGPQEVLVVGSENPFEQFVTVAKHFQLDVESNAFRRCLECNCVLVAVRKEDHEERIPPHVYRTQTTFSQCTGCGRLYWPGTHYQAMRRRLALVRDMV